MRYEAYIYTRLQGFSQKMEHVETPKSRLSSTFPPVRFRFWGSPFWKQYISLKFTFSPQQPQLLRHISTAPCDSNLARLVSNQWSFLVEWASYCDTTGTVLSFCLCCHLIESLRENSQRNTPCMDLVLVGVRKWRLEPSLQVQAWQKKGIWWHLDSQQDCNKGA